MISYQNYFNNKCMICLTQPSENKRHRLLVDSNNNKRNQNNNQSNKYSQ